MKKFLTLASVALTAVAMSAQTFSTQQNICSAAPAAADNPLQWIQYCDYNTTTVMGVGTSGNPGLHAVTLFKTETLKDYNGKAISLAAIYLNSTITTGATVFVVKGDDLSTAQRVSEVKVDQLAQGWNIVKFDSPVTIDASERMGVGYSITDNASYPVAFDGKGAVANTSYLQVESQGYSLADKAWGNLMVRALVDGDASPLGYNLVINELGLAKYLPANQPVDVTMRLTNSSFETINSFTYEVSINGNKQVKEATLDKPIANNSESSYTFTLDPITEESKFEITITKVNGHDNAGAITLSKTLVPYEAADTFERNIFIEKFTGQNCGYCPGGEVSIAKAIEGVEDRVVRVDHHYGYTKDIFTIEESEKIGSSFGVRSAPSCMVDRTIQDERAGTKADGIVFHPGYLTKEMIRNAISIPAFVSLAIEPAYDEATREATIKVTGMTHKDLSGTRLTVCLTQSGYEAYQNSANANWRHNDFPIDYMTPFNGEEIQWNEDGTFACTYKYTISEAYGKVVPDADMMDVVAYVCRWDNDNHDIMNSATCKLTDKYNSVDSAITETARVAFANGQFTIAGSTLGVEVYTIDGKRVANVDLTAGLYIVRATVGGNVVVRKMTVR